MTPECENLVAHAERLIATLQTRALERRMRRLSSRLERAGFPAEGQRMRGWADALQRGKLWFPDEAAVEYLDLLEAALRTRGVA